MYPERYFQPAGGDGFQVGITEAHQGSEYTQQAEKEVKGKPYPPSWRDSGSLVFHDPRSDTYTCARIYPWRSIAYEPKCTQWHSFFAASAGVCRFSLLTLRFQSGFVDMDNLPLAFTALPYIGQSAVSIIIVFSAGQDIGGTGGFEAYDGQVRG